MAEDPAVEARDRDVDAARAEIRDEHVAGVRPERQLARRATARARPYVALLEQAAIDQLADPSPDDRAAEPRPGDQLGAGARPPEAHLVQHDDEGVQGFVG